MTKEPKRIDVPDRLIQLQRESNAARREAVRGGYSSEAWRPWLEAVAKAQRAITEHAESTKDVNRVDVEMETKRRAREADEAEASPPPRPDRDNAVALR
ncbi:hypothetical protein ACIQVO_36690 [Streptomyces sp. NPDC101062]|uniref:hypothetical protein n=1 Tax=unclassified Streptomyces TaxID=2593676 RepID=UPI00381ECDFE